MISLGLRIINRVWASGRRRLQHRLDHGQRLHGDFRQRHAPSLAVVLCGYKPALWDFTIARLPAASAELDVCLVGAGRMDDRLRGLAKERGWSCTTTSGRWPGPALNAAIRAHAQARFIHKIDEDMLLPSHYFPRMEAGWRRIEAIGHYRLGFLAPLINVNGYSYVHVLRALDADKDYLSHFGELRHAAGDIHAHYDGAAARYLWEKSLPFDAVAERIAKRSWEWSTVPHRFSIGAILLRREFWEEIGGFRRLLSGSVLGADEDHLCRECVARSQVMAVDHSIFAGHFSFGPQEQAMLEFLPAMRHQLMPQ